MSRYNYLYYLIIILVLDGVILSGQGYDKPKKHPVSTRLNNEDCPVLFNDTLIFLSNRSNTSMKKYYDYQDRNYFDIYYSVLDTSTKSWSIPKIFSPELKTNYSDGPVSFDKTGNIIALSRSLALTTGRGRGRNNPFMGIFFAEKKTGKWGNLKEYSFNSTDGHTTHPSLDTSGTVLYFSSNRSGGYGGYDLYLSKYVNGAWTPPQNLGPRLNTTGNEIYPFIHPSGRLYFSSEGHDRNIGGLDIFYSESYNDKWIDPVKLPSPFNSGLKDYTYFADEKFEKGFFTSNRGGSVDIYSFQSTLPAFEVCQQQRRDNFCFILYEENTIELDTNLYAYEWDLGDSTRVRDIQARHCYAGSGDFMVKLNVIDKLTNEVLFNQANYELKIERIEQPYISCPDTMIINQDIQFNGVLSYFKSIRPGEYYWDFGDGDKSIGASARHNFKIPGTYTIKLGVVEDNEKAEELKKFCSFRTITIKEQ